MNRYYCLRWLLSILKLPWYLGVFARGVRSKSGLWCCTHELGAPVQTSKVLSFIETLFFPKQTACNHLSQYFVDVLAFLAYCLFPKYMAES